MKRIDETPMNRRAIAPCSFCPIGLLETESRFLFLARDVWGKVGVSNAPSRQLPPPFAQSVWQILLTPQTTVAVLVCRAKASGYHRGKASRSPPSKSPCQKNLLVCGGEKNRDCWFWSSISIFGWDLTRQSWICRLGPLMWDLLFK